MKLIWVPDLAMPAMNKHISRQLAYAFKRWSADLDAMADNDDLATQISDLQNLARQIMAVSCDCQQMLAQQEEQNERSDNVAAND